MFLEFVKLIIFANKNFREADERRQLMLSQILSSQARERRKSWITRTTRVTGTTFFLLLKYLLGMVQHDS